MSVKIIRVLRQGFGVPPGAALYQTALKSKNLIMSVFFFSNFAFCEKKKKKKKIHVWKFYNF